MRSATPNVQKSALTARHGTCAAAPGAQAGLPGLPHGQGRVLWGPARRAVRAVQAAGDAVRAARRRLGAEQRAQAQALPAGLAPDRAARGGAGGRAGALAARRADRGHRRRRTRLEARTGIMQMS